MHLKFFWRRFEIICLLSCYKNSSVYGASKVQRQFLLFFLKLGLSKTKLFYCKANACYILFLFLRVCPNRNKVFLYLLIPCFELVQHFLVRPIVPFYHSFIIPELTKKVGMLMSQFRIPHAKWPLYMKKSNFWANY